MCDTVMATTLQCVVYQFSFDTNELKNEIAIKKYKVSLNFVTGSAFAFFVNKGCRKYK